MHTDTRDRRIGQIAWVMAWVGLVVGQFHAMARHNTADGKGDLEMWTTRVWSDPARKLFAPLLDWGTPDAVYLTYGKIWFPVFLAFTVCAFVVRRRQQTRGFATFAWRFALLGYCWATVAVFVSYWTQWTHTTSVLDLAFLFLDIPGLLLTLLGSTMLGITLLRQGFRPRATGWLLTLAIPIAIALQLVTSMGSAALSVAFAFGIAGRALARDQVTAPAPHAAAVPG